MLACGVVGGRGWGCLGESLTRDTEGPFVIDVSLGGCAERDCSCCICSVPGVTVCMWFLCVE